MLWLLLPNHANHWFTRSFGACTMVMLFVFPGFWSYGNSHFLLLSLHYANRALQSFDSICLIIFREKKYPWLNAKMQFDLHLILDPTFHCGINSCIFSIFAFFCLISQWPQCTQYALKIRQIPVELGKRTRGIFFVWFTDIHDHLWFNEEQGS